MQFMLLLISVIGTIAAQVTFDVSLSTDCSTPAVGSVVLPDNFVCTQSGLSPRYTRESTCTNVRNCLQNLYSSKNEALANETLSCLYDELSPIPEAHYVNFSSGATFSYYSFFAASAPVSCSGQSFDFEATTVSSTCSVMPTQERPAVPCISFAVQGTLPNATTSTTTGGGGGGDGTTSGGDGGDGGDNSSAAAVIEYIY